MSFPPLFLLRCAALVPILGLLGGGTPAQRGAAAGDAMSQEARTYLDAALDLMQDGSVRRKQVDWSALRAAALDRASGAQRPADTYPAIRQALDQIGDGHSFLITPTDGLGDHDHAPPPPVEMVARLLDGGVGYLRVPGCYDQEPAALTAWAVKLQELITEVDASSPVSWVVDLRDDTGGNMWPMLAGLGPVLGEGVLGSFVPPEGRATPWSYEGGVARVGTNDACTVPEPHQLSRPAPPVAVLTGKQTASSGEAVVVAFRGRPNTRSFGAPTAGVSTANDMLRLSDGALLFLTAATYADRTGRLYGEEIAPDVRVEEREGRDATLETALTWLRGQTASVPGAAALIGRWRVDLRPTPDAEPYYQELVIESVKDDEIRGAFYGSKIREGRLNRAWGELRFAFVTEDGSGPYHTAGRLAGDRLEGTTHSLGRDFLAVWSAERQR